MKLLVLGMMIASVSFSFAQADQTPTHQLKKKFSANQQMRVEPVSMIATPNKKSTFQQEKKSEMVIGTIRMIDGTPFIDVNIDREEHRMMPVNLPRAFAVDGQMIQFRYTVSDAPFPKNVDCSLSINVDQTSMPQDIK